MSKIIYDSFFVILVILAGIIIVISFFLPWVSADTSVVRASKAITKAAGPLEGVPFFGDVLGGIKNATDVVRDIGDIDLDTVVSGRNIPKMVNERSSKAALSFMQSYWKEARDLDKKAMLVYLMPVCAFICVLLAMVGMRYIVSIIFMGIVSGLISLGGLYNLNTMNISNEVVTITIEKGLWHTMYAYLFIFILSIVWLSFSIVAKRKRKIA